MDYRLGLCNYFIPKTAPRLPYFEKKKKDLKDYIKDWSKMECTSNSTL